jgi:lipopolysaccharide export system permease protein
VAFLSLFYFIDFVDELDQVGRNGYTLWLVALRALLELPGHFYELFPISVLIGTIYSMARLAQSSEFTILRTGGLGPGRALRMLSFLGLGFALLTWLVGDFVAPWSEREAVLLKASVRGGLSLGSSGAWLKERRQAGMDDERSVSVNVAAATAGGDLREVRVYEFDRDGRLRTRIQAESAKVEGNGSWTMRSAVRTEWPTPQAAGQGARLLVQESPTLVWPTSLDADVVAAALLPVQTMSTLELWRYSSHLTVQDQSAQRHEIQFWKKALYPLACIVMVALALPFAYLQARRGGISVKVFGGIMLGISFVLLNNVAGHLGVLREWTPWVVAAAPSVIYLLLSMAAFAWLVRYR